MRKKSQRVNGVRTSAKISSFVQKLREKEESRNREKGLKWCFDFKHDVPGPPSQDCYDENRLKDESQTIDW